MHVHCLFPLFVLLGSLLFPIGTALAGPYTDPGHPVVDITAWADAVDELVRGPIDIAQPGGELASFGAPETAVGPATGNPFDAVSLGDGGSVTLSFALGIHNGPGDDLAVFENGFYFPHGLFSELAFVEVATNGVDFARFPATALAPLPVASFDPIDPTDYHGLAGRHEIDLGTGFDLEALAADPLVVAGDVDLLDIRQVRIVDVVGDGSRLDRAGRPIFDPYATAFAAGGFDLEAVGALYVAEPSVAGGLVAGLGALGLGFPVRRSRNRPSSHRGRKSSPAADRRGLHRLIGLAVLTATTFFGFDARPVSALTATFDDLGLAPNSFLNGSTLAGGYTSGGIFFENDYEASFGSFSGFAASTRTDSTTPGFGNQFSNITGSGAGGSNAYGIGYFNGRIVLPEPQIVLGAQFTNTTYTALSMRDGDPFSKRFGGPTGTDPDYYRLIVEGIDDLGGSTGTVEMLLADYRFADSAQDYILDEWVFLDLSGLGAVRELRFGLDSSDVGPFGINTPVYFAIDDLVTIPEPGHAVLIGLGLALLAHRPRASR